MANIFNESTINLFKIIFSEEYIYINLKMQFKNESITFNKYMNINKLPNNIEEIVNLFDMTGKKIYQEFIDYNKKCEFDFMKKKLIINYIIKKNDCDNMNIFYEFHTYDGNELIFF